MGYQIYKYIIYFLYCLLIGEQIIVIIGRKKRSVYHMLLCALVIMTVGGYMVMMNAKNAEVALEANKVTYLGGCLLPIVVLKIGADLCNLKMKMWIYVMISLVGIIAMAMAWSAGYMDLYYSDYSIEIVNGITILHKVYGPWHAFYYFYLALYFAVTVVVIVHCVRNRRNYSNRMVIIFTAIWGTIYFTYYGERLLNLNVKIMPVALAVGMTIFVAFFRRANLLSMNTNMLNIEEREEENGYVVVNYSNRLMGLNRKAAEFFPELSGLGIDDKFEKIKDTCFCEKIIEPAFSKDENLSEEVENNGYHLRVIVREIKAPGQVGDRGKVVEIRDISAEARYKEMLRDYRERLEEEVAEKTESLDRIRQTIVMGMASMIESRDFSTGGHIRRTSDVVDVFAQELMDAGTSLSRKFLHMVVIAAPMHDLGKIAVDDAVLRKKGKYTPEEYEAMKMHAANGAVIVRRVFSGMDDEELVNVVANVAHFHHEKWNGTGYPLGLKGEEIPIEARIMALADVFDALVSKRYYKDAYSYDEAFKIIEDSIGSHFDPELGRIFLNARPKLEEMYDRFAKETVDEVGREETE